MTDQYYWRKESDRFNGKPVGQCGTCGAFYTHFDQCPENEAWKQARDLIDGKAQEDRSE